MLSYLLHLKQFLDEKSTIGKRFPVGITTVTSTATELAGNKATSSFKPVCGIFLCRTTAVVTCRSLT